MTRRRLSLGLSLGVSPRESFQRIVDVVRKAETYGFESVCFTDVPLSMKDCYIALAFCALNTASIKLGTGVTNPVTRHPSVIANVMSNLQELSNGRVFLGLGAGYSAVYHVGLEPASVRQLEEAITYIRTLCRGEEYVNGPLRIRLATARRPVPIFVAASQPRMLTLAGMVADGVILMGGADVEFTRWQIQHIKKGAEAAGRPFEDIVLDLWFAMSVSGDSRKAIDDVRPWVVAQAESFSKWRNLPEFLRPYVEDVLKAARAYDPLGHLSRHATHRAVVSDELVTKLAVTGDAPECLRRLNELAGLGIQKMTVALLPGGREERLRVIAEEIMPYV